MKSLYKLLSTVTRECGDICSVDTTRDLETIMGRVEDEGQSFLTITLTNYGKALERGLDQGFVTPKMFAGFSLHRGLPRLFGGFLELIFARETGILLDEPSIDAIRALRQLTLMWGKVKLDCTEDRVNAAFDKFIECELELEDLEDRVDLNDRLEFIRISSMLFSGIFHKADLAIRSYEVSPKHSGGATAEKTVANKKYLFNSWTRRLEEVFPYWRNATSRPYCTSRYESIKFYEPGAELPVRVVSVPKTLKTPRIIAIEPSWMQFMQQAILRLFREGTRDDMLISSMASSDSQTPNQRMAQIGSSDGSLATLDLSEASDRVSKWLADDLFVLFPHLHDGVMASRSTHADVPNHGIVPLNKFASMGSALCFPVQMYVFLTIIFMGIQKARGIKFTKREQFASFLGQVRVYGDDIIVPVDTAVSVATYLELFGLKVNSNKSFWTGKFRESCGAEFYNGEDVSLTRVRNVFPSSRRDVDSMISAVDLRNQLYKAGYWSSVRYMDVFLSKLIPMPAVADTSTALGKFSFLGYEEQKTCPNLHRPMVRACVVKYQPRASKISDDAALMKFFLKEGDQPIFSKDHLDFAGRPVASSINYRWTYSY